MKPLALLQLMFLLQCNLQLFTMTRAAFSFTTTILTHSTNGNCFGDDLSGACETFFPTFCLRGPRVTRSTSITDCPLGTVNGLSPSESSGSRVINSNAAWPVRICASALRLLVYTCHCMPHSFRACKSCIVCVWYELLLPFREVFSFSFKH